MMKSLLVALVLAAGCSRSESPPPPAATQPAAKDPAKARELIAAGAIVLDVRTPDEYREGHVASATNIPVDDVDAHLADIAKLAPDKAKPIVVYCAAGKRAARAKQRLEAAGYTNVVNGGGYDDLH